jgi:histidinol dehydrogenase
MNRVHCVWLPPYLRLILFCPTAVAFLSCLPPHTCRWTPESVGDYASGTNHVLPTYGYARMYSGVSLDSFTKKMTVQSLSWEGLQVLGPHVAKMAEVEGLEAHRRAVTLRLEQSS